MIEVIYKDEKQTAKGNEEDVYKRQMRGVVKALSNAVEDLEVYGFDDGYKGLIYGKMCIRDSR